MAIRDPGFADDDGSADPAVAAELVRLADGAGDPARLLRAVATSRLLVPVVAVLEEAEVGDDGVRRDKASSMASVSVQAADGTRSLLGFTSVDSLRAWRADARPIAASAQRVAQAALAEGADALVVDPAGPVPFAITGAELAAVAVAADPAAPTAGLVGSVAAAVAARNPEVAVVAVTVEPGGRLQVAVAVDPARAGASPDPATEVVAELRTALEGDPLLRVRGPQIRLVLLPTARADDVDATAVVYRRA